MYESNQNTLARPSNGGLAGGQYAGTQTATARDTVQQALDEQEKQVDELHGALNALADRLMVVLGPPDTSANKNLDSPQPPPSMGLLDRVRRHSSAIHNASSRLHDLMQRLQV